ncbi:MAG: YggS family pyridoxal phosphate-dependent enzyme [Nitrospiraceae bacterium]
MADTVDPDAIARNVEVVFENIRRAAQCAGRPVDSIRLIAVTKSVSMDRIRLAIDAGVKIWGENRLQEALPKLTAVGPRDDLAWHFIGRLQRRKVKAVVGRFQMIHSLDSIELAAEVDRRAGEAGLCQPVLLEVNIGGEPSKAGFLPSAMPDALATLDGMPNLSVRGLMAIPPPSSEPETARPYFRRVCELARSLARPGLRRVRMEHLSMGMSQDYEIAVEEGATMVRVGTAIFGARPTLVTRPSTPLGTVSPSNGNA